jgi:hypothetical protein
MGYDYEDCLFCYLRDIPKSPKNEGYLCLACMFDIQDDLNTRMKDSLNFVSYGSECDSCDQYVPIGFQMTLCSKVCIEEYRIPLPEKPS